MRNLKKYSTEFLISESKSLLTRLEEVKPFKMTMPMVRSASVSEEAYIKVSDLLDKGKLDLNKRICNFINKLNSNRGIEQNEHYLQNQFSSLKLRFTQILNQLDIFADVFTQRGEHETGIWLSGLDVLAEDGLKVGKSYFTIPPLVVYLERGHGAAIRRARTRLPGGQRSPVAIIQIPRERMVGNGVAVSILHEVGHQGSVLLNLIPSLKPVIKEVKQNTSKKYKSAWYFFNRWISEVLADFWAVAQLGLCATIGLMGVLSLPNYFQFRIKFDDPHPIPYIRVMLSCRFGRKLFPDPQWNQIWNTWRSFYPISNLPQEKQVILKVLEHEMDHFINLIIEHRPASLKGKRLIDIFNTPIRQPNEYRRMYQAWKLNPGLIKSKSPVCVFAVLGQAKADHAINSFEENHLLKQQLNLWAITRNK